MLDSIGDGVIATDTNGLITHMNPVAVNLTGYSLEEAIGKNLEQVFNIVNQDTEATVENPVSKVINTGKIVELANHTILISKNGKKSNIADSAAPIKQDNEIRGVVLVFRDVTEQYALQKRSL